MGAGFLILLFGMGILFIITVIFLEAFVMSLMRYHPAYRQSVLHSLVVNLISLAAGFVLTDIDAELFQLDNWSGLSLMFLVTVVLEFISLYLMNRSLPVMRTLGVCLLMNLVTYAIAVLLILATG